MSALAVADNIMTTTATSESKVRQFYTCQFITYRHSIAGEVYVFSGIWLFICGLGLFVCQHDDFQTIKYRMMKLGG